MVPFVLETVGGVEGDAVLFVIAKRLIRLLLGVLVAEPESDMRSQLITKGGCTAVTLNVLR